MSYPNDQGLDAGSIPVRIVGPGAGGYTPNVSLVFPATIPTSSTPLFSGGIATHRLTIFNNSTTAILWVNEAGGTAVVGSGIRIAAGGGSYYWSSGLPAVPTGISDGAGGSTAASISGTGG